MPEAILAGPNGGPAIDELTGMPLTMEELLRRRGILAYKGVVSPLNQGQVPATPVNAADAATTALADATAATANNSDGSAIAIGASPNSVGANGEPIGATPGTPKLTTEAVAEAPGPGSDPGDWLNWLFGSVATGAGLYALSRLGRKDAPTAAEALAEGQAAGMRAARGPTVNPNLQVVEGKSEVIGSNRKLDQLIDGKNAAKAGEIGAGPKALSGTAPVTDTSLQGAVAEQKTKGRLPDYYAPGSRPRTRMETGALQANQSRVQRPGTVPIQLRDRFSDLTDSEYKVGTEVAGRMLSDRKAGVGKLPNRIGSTKPRNRAIRNQEIAGGPIRDPRAESAAVLMEALNRVRALKQQGFDVSRILPRLRIVR